MALTSISPPDYVAFRHINGRLFIKGEDQEQKYQSWTNISTHTHTHHLKNHQSDHQSWTCIFLPWGRGLDLTPQLSGLQVHAEHTGTVHATAFVGPGQLGEHLGRFSWLKSGGSKASPDPLCCAKSPRSGGVSLGRPRAVSSHCGTKQCPPEVGCSAIFPDVWRILVQKWGFLKKQKHINAAHRPVFGG